MLIGEEGEMTFQNLKDNLILDNMVKRFNERAYKDSMTIEKFGGCYKLGELYYQPAALKRDLAYFELENSHYNFKEIERFKILLYTKNIDFVDGEEKIYILSKRREIKQKIAEVEFDGNSFIIEIYDKSFRYSNHLNEIETLRIIKRLVFHNMGGYFSWTDDIYCLDPIRNRLEVSKLVKLTKAEREEIIKKIRDKTDEGIFE